MIPDTLTHLAVDIRALRPFARNPRNGDIDAIAESLEVRGQYKAIVARAGTNEILAGNHVYAAAMQLAWPELATTFVDVSDDEAARIVLVDNRTSDRGRYDSGLLLNLLDDLHATDIQLDGTGYSQQDLDDLTVRVSDQLAKDLNTQTPPIPERFTVLVECESKDAQAMVLDRLRAQGLQCRAMTT